MLVAGELLPRSKAQSGHCTARPGETPAGGPAFPPRLHSGSLRGCPGSTGRGQGRGCRHSSFLKGLVRVADFAQFAASHAPGETREPGGRPGGGGAPWVPPAPRGGGGAGPASGHLRDPEGKLRRGAGRAGLAVAAHPARAPGG